MGTLLQSARSRKMLEHLHNKLRAGIFMQKWLSKKVFLKRVLCLFVLFAAFGPQQQGPMPGVLRLVGAFKLHKSLKHTPHPLKVKKLHMLAECNKNLFYLFLIIEILDTYVSLSFSLSVIYNWSSGTRDARPAPPRPALRKTGLPCPALQKWQNPRGATGQSWL